jgi:hypothetical protein
MEATQAAALSGNTINNWENRAKREGTPTWFVGRPEVVRQAQNAFMAAENGSADFVATSLKPVPYAGAAVALIAFVASRFVEGGSMAETALTASAVGVGAATIVGSVSAFIAGKIKQHAQAKAIDQAMGEMSRNMLNLESQPVQEPTVRILQGARFSKNPFEARLASEALARLRENVIARQAAQDAAKAAREAAAAKTDEAQAPAASVPPTPALSAFRAQMREAPIETGSPRVVRRRSIG